MNYVLKKIFSKKSEILLDCIKKIQSDDDTISIVLFDLIKKDIKKYIRKTYKKISMFKGEVDRYYGFVSKIENINIPIELQPTGKIKYNKDDICHKYYYDLENKQKFPKTFEETENMLKQLEKSYKKFKHSYILNYIFDTQYKYYYNNKTRLEYALLVGQDLPKYQNIVKKNYNIDVGTFVSKAIEDFENYLMLLAYARIEKNELVYDYQFTKNKEDIETIPLAIMLEVRCGNDFKYDIPQQIIKAYVKQTPTDPESKEVKEALKNVIPETVFIDNWDDADIVWRGITKGFDDKLYERLSNNHYGLINHFTNADALVRKDNLALHLEKNNLRYLAPHTFVWNSQTNKSELLKKIKEYGIDMMWIVKPVSAQGYGGMGIKLFDSDKIKKFLDKPTKIPYVIQTYIQNPILYKGRKFDIRIYVLVTPIQHEQQKFNIYMFWGGLVRVSKKKYDHTSVDPEVFLTNTCVQSKTPTPSEASIPLHEAQCTKEYDDIQLDIFDIPSHDYTKAPIHSGMNYATILPRIKKSVEQLFKNVDFNPKNYGASFQLFGLDYILDFHGAPNILEVNSTPSIQYINVSPASEAIKKPLLNRMFEIVLANKLGIDVSKLIKNETKYEFTKIL